MSSWVWTSASFRIWLRFVQSLLPSHDSCYNKVELSSRVFSYLLIRIFRLFNDDADQEPVKLKKHEVIAQAYSKRKMLEENGRVSISCHNDDPVGLNFDPNSVTSQDLSATWAANLPHLVERRGALVGSVTTSAARRDSLDSRYSNDSKYSFSVRRVSIASRRNSGDSQFAVSIDEVIAHAQLRDYRGHQEQEEDHSVRNKRRKRRVREKNRVRGYKVTKSRRSARGYLGNSQDTPAVDTDY